MNLCEMQRTSKLNIDSLKVNITDIVQVFYEKVLRRFWKIPIVTWVLPSRNSEKRGLIVRIEKTSTILKCSENKIFAVKNTYHNTNQMDKASNKKNNLPFPCCPVLRCKFCCDYKLDK